MLTDLLSDKKNIKIKRYKVIAYKNKTRVKINFLEMEKR